MAVRCTLHFDPTLTFDVLTGGRDLAAAAGRERTGKKDGQERGATSSPAGAVLVGPFVWAACTCLSSCRRARKLERIEGDDFIRTTPLIARLGMAERATREKRKRPELNLFHRRPASSRQQQELRSRARHPAQGGTGRRYLLLPTNLRRRNGTAARPQAATLAPEGEQNKNARQKPATGDAHWSDNKERGKTTRDDNDEHRWPSHRPPLAHVALDTTFTGTSEARGILGAGKRGGGMAQQQQRWTLAGRDRRRDRTGGAEPGRTASASKGERKVLVRSEVRTGSSGTARHGNLRNEEETDATEYTACRQEAHAQFGTSNSDFEQPMPLSGAEGSVFGHVPDSFSTSPSQREPISPWGNEGTYPPAAASPEADL
ncbi:hypothetical protein CMUS01_09998 [Colletotrichum musicola]|uniref:Uncharacterized protein n=1 Tax=Colletotrichum musicola TaxID=2175873 RepID=A0A8H6K538_9PEZI|nr:hypothetical protein CMUS01_09998 [Colletotrichum musicola]